MKPVLDIRTNAWAVASSDGNISVSGNTHAKLHTNFAVNQDGSMRGGLWVEVRIDPHGYGDYQTMETTISWPSYSFGSGNDTIRPAKAMGELLILASSVAVFLETIQPRLLAGALNGNSAETVIQDYFAPRRSNVDLGSLADQEWQLYGDWQQEGALPVKTGSI